MNFAILAICESNMIDYCDFVFSSRTWTPHRGCTLSYDIDMSFGLGDYILSEEEKYSNDLTVVNVPELF